MLDVNESNYENNSYTLFGPMGMAFFEDGNYIDDTYPVKIILSIYLGATMVLNIIGNVCTCAVIVRNRSMRTPTNCYLFNIAVTDLITGFFVPVDIYIIWVPDYYPLGEVGCRLHYILWDFILNYSLLIITAFTLERYLVVTRPFLRQKFALNSRVYKIAGAIWFICVVFIIPDVFYIDILERKKHVFCYFTIAAGIHSAFAGFEVLFLSVVPMLIITVLYVLIFIELKSEKRKPRASPMIVQHNRDKAIKMLAAVSATFFFFFSPYCILRVMTVLPGLSYENNYTAWKIVNYLCYFGYLSTVANPILYSLMSRKFRMAFKDLLKGGKSPNHQGSNTRITSSISITKT